MKAKGILLPALAHSCYLTVLIEKRLSIIYFAVINFLLSKK
jgi:hypothetical protein